MNFGILLATILLVAVSVAHIVRMIYGWQVTIADAIIPMWASGVAAVITGIAAILLWRGARPKN